jgi:hypothetical protein
MLSLGRRIGQGFWMVFLLGMSTTPGGVYVPLLVQVLHGVTPAAAGYPYAVQSLSWTLGTILSAQVSPVRARAVLVLGPLLTATGFTGLFFTIGAGPVAAIAASLMLVGIGIGTCWAHIGTAILRRRAPTSALTASMIPEHQLFAVALGAALSGVIANAAGLGGGASPGRRPRSPAPGSSAASWRRRSQPSSSAHSFVRPLTRLQQQPEQLLMISSAGTTVSASGKSGMAIAPTIWTIVSLPNGTGFISLTTS